MIDHLTSFVQHEKTQETVSYGASIGLIAASLLVDIASVLQVLGLLIGVLIGLLRLRYEWRRRNDP